MSWGRFYRRTRIVPLSPLRGWWRVACGLLVVLWGLTLRPRPLLAHNELRQSTPAAGEVLAESPATIRLQFSEPPANTFVRLFDRSFNEVSGVEILPAGEQTLEVVVRVPTLNPGVYTVQWLTLSQDNHAVSGTFQFEVQGTSPSTLVNNLIMGVLAAAILAGILYFRQQLEPLVNLP